MPRQAKITRIMLRFVEDVRLPSGQVTRRQWLHLSTLAGLGLATGRAAPAAESTANIPGFGRAKSVILVFTNGGQSQIDMWDPKPSAPLDVRGAFQPIATAIPGIQFCEHMPRIARVADRFTVVRSMSHEDLDHGSAAYLALTGVYHRQRSANPLPSPSDLPTYGAVLRRIESKSKFVYDAVHLNGPALVPTNLSPGQDGGLLGRAYEPLVVGDPSDAAGVVSDLAPQVGLPPVRMSSRLSLKQTLDHYAARLESNERAMDMNRLYQQACQMLASRETREAFDIEAEPANVRDRYGRHRSGQSLLLARRLVEAGVPYINVIWNQSNR